MAREDFSFTSPEGTGPEPIEVACYRWPAAGKPIGIVQISHGMGEHSLRYADLAAHLNQAGFHVYSNDHRGHGRTARSKKRWAISAQADGMRSSRTWRA